MSKSLQSWSFDKKKELVKYVTSPDPCREKSDSNQDASLESTENKARFNGVSFEEFDHFKYFLNVY